MKNLVTHNYKNCTKSILFYGMITRIIFLKDELFSFLLYLLVALGTSSILVPIDT